MTSPQAANSSGLGRLTLAVRDVGRMRQLHAPSSSTRSFRPDEQPSYHRSIHHARCPRSSNRASAVAPYPGVDTANAAPSPISAPPARTPPTKPAASRRDTVVRRARCTTRLPACLNSGDVARPVPWRTTPAMGGVQRSPARHGSPCRRWSRYPGHLRHQRAQHGGRRALPQRSGSSRKLLSLLERPRYMSFDGRSRRHGRATLFTTASQWKLVRLGGRVDMAMAIADATRRTA